MRAVVLAMPLLLLAACAPMPEPPPDCHIGTLTPEGATCQTMRDAKDRLFSFYADMTGHKIGDDVCVCGPVAEMSFCGQGTVIEVTHLGQSCPAE